MLLDMDQLNLVMDMDPLPLRPLPLPLSLASEDAATRPTTQYGSRSERSETEKSPTGTVSLTGFGTNAIGSAFVSASLLGAIEY